MKLYKLKIVAISLMIIMAFAQCKKSLLDVAPTIPISTLDDYYQNESEAVKAVNAAYTPLSTI